MKNLTFKMINFNKNYHQLDVSKEDRSGDYEWLEYIQGKWEFTKQEIGFSNGNVDLESYFDREKQTFFFSDEMIIHAEKRNYSQLTRILDAPNLLYRLICIFYMPPKTGNWYKAIWSYTIKHKQTGKLLDFGEHKGATGFWLPEMHHDQLGEAFKNDLIEFLNFLVSDQCPHPYDSCTAGQIA